ncbi:hypothetical protein HanIR_Chr14g0688941 [Helianthus annuus]|nr:hypothetical protein HanIR_Chr14g0688941 [Helianthus annuus]
MAVDRVAVLQETLITFIAPILIRFIFFFAAISFSIKCFLQIFPIFSQDYGIGAEFTPTAPACDASVDKCPAGFIALYCRHFEFSNLRYPFSLFVLNLLEYYRVSFGQIHPKGMARVLHFEVLCRALGYDPSLLLFRRFFRLAKNGDWFTFEASKVDSGLISSMVTTLGVWKDRFFWVSDTIVPFKTVWRHPDAVLNEPEPLESDLNDAFLQCIRKCPARVCPFPEHLLVLLGVSKLWEKSRPGSGSDERWHGYVCVGLY